MAATSVQADRYRFSLSVAWFLAVVFLDELVDGYFSAAWPAIKNDLRLSLTQIGLLTGVPRFLGNILELPLGLLADSISRRRLIATGGLAFALATVLLGAAPGFAVFMAGLLLFNPASGAFVSISQASLMDMAPRLREVNMARWSFAGSLGNLAGPLLLAGAVAIGWGWRPAFGFIALLALVATVFMPRVSRADSGRTQAASKPEANKWSIGLVDSLQAARRQGVARWLVMLECSDLLLDVFRGFLALYMVQVAATSQEFAGLTIMALTAASLTGGALMAPLLRRINGIAYLRASAGAAMLVFPTFLTAGPPQLKVALVALIGLLTSGWYAVLKAGLYAQLPGRSGAAMAFGSISGLFGAVIPIALGSIADAFGLQTAMWLLLAAPLCLLLGLPRSVGTTKRVG